MGPEFPSDTAGDGPEYGDMEISSETSSARDSDSDDIVASDSSYDPDKERKLARKNFNSRRSKKTIEKSNSGRSK